MNINLNVMYNSLMFGDLAEEMKDVLIKEKFKLHKISKQLSLSHLLFGIGNYDVFLGYRHLTSSIYDDERKATNDERLSKYKHTFLSITLNVWLPSLYRASRLSVYGTLYLYYSSLLGILLLFL